MLGRPRSIGSESSVRLRVKSPRSRREVAQVEMQLVAVSVVTNVKMVRMCQSSSSSESNCRNCIGFSEMFVIRFRGVLVAEVVFNSPDFSSNFGGWIVIDDGGGAQVVIVGGRVDASNERVAACTLGERPP